MTTERTCPECCSPCEVCKTEQTRAIPFGEVRWEQSVLHCPSCGYNEPLETADSLLQAAIEKGRDESVRTMLTSLKNEGIPMAQLERSLGLAPRTAHHWKGGTHSAGVLALLRFVATYPWLVEVARLDFDVEVADSALLQAAEHLLAKHGLNVHIAQAEPTTADNVVDIRVSGSMPPLGGADDSKVYIG